MKHGTRKKSASTKASRPVKDRVTLPGTVTLLKQPQTIIGAIVLIAALCLGGIMVLSTQLQLPNSQVETEVVPTPIQLPAQAQPIQLEAKPTPVPTASAAAQVTPALKLQVKKDQTFWEFASRYCGDHDQAEALAHANGYKTVTDLKAGDWITITCQ